MASYPGLPDNRLIIFDNGVAVDLTEKYKLVLADGYVLGPPEPITNVVDIPGSLTGPLDLTEALTGDVAYGNRKQEITFYVIYPENFEKVKTEISNLLHGKRFNYKLTMDPEYTYNGRFAISSYTSNKDYGTIQVSIDAEPYKLKEQKNYKVDAAGGMRMELYSGRLPVHPIVETTMPTIVTFDGIQYNLGTGTYRMNDVTLREGLNTIYFKSMDLTHLTWGDVGSSGTYPMQWNTKITWDAVHKNAANIPEDAGVCYVIYDWKDL